MGIQGLLPFLKKIHQPVNIAKFAGCTVAIDAYCWLHKGAFSCAEKLVLGEKTDQYVYYCMKFLENMLKNNLKPIMVFDGCHLPSKKDVEKSRREKRDMHRKKAAQFLREGNRAEARECLQRCIDISPEMALRLMEVCRERGIDCIQAPYEADSQLAYLSKAGIAQIIVTEDSDLLLFGCDKVIFKMDHQGNGILIEKSHLNEVLEIQNGFYTFEKFRYMCILSGCDYLPSLSGIGLVKACKVFKLARQSDLKTLLKKFPSTYLKMSLPVSDEYIEGFIKANNTFLYQLVFDPLSRRLVPLNDYEQDMEPGELHYAGPYIPPEKALQIALGNINIYTMQKFADFDPDTFVPSKASKKKPESLHMLSIWDKNYRVKPKSFLTETQNRPNLKGKEVTVKAKLPKIEHKVKKAEDSIEVKTDTELSGMYLDSPQRNERETTETKKSNKRRLESESSEEEPSPKKKYKLKESPSKEGPPSKKKYNKFTRSPSKVEFFSSLVEADNEMTDTDQDDNKENGFVSPRRNRFAVASPSKKPKFNLNAPKEVVKSRFFTSASMPDLKPKEETDKNNCDETEPEEQPSKDSGKCISSETDQTFTSPTQSGKPSSDQTKQKSAFSWCRFKSTRQSGSVDASPGSRNPFKKVVSQKPDSSLSRTSSQNSIDKFSQGDSQGGACSQISRTNSIDSFCLANSQEVELSQRDDTISDSRLADCLEEESSMNSPQATPEDVIVIKDEPVDISTNNTKIIQKTSVMSGCRPSGLSKGKKKPVNVDVKQKSLKDMFSKFSNDRTKNLPKLKHDKKEDLSATPSSDNSVISARGGIQRCILP